MNLWGFISAAVLLTLMPGPDILFVITQSITRGRKAGMVFAAGLCTGCQSGCFDFADEFSCSFYDVEVCRCCLFVVSWSKSFSGPSGESFRVVGRRCCQWKTIPERDTDEYIES